MPPDPTMHTKLFTGAMKFATGVGPLEIDVIAQETREDRIGDVLEAKGVRLDNYRRNPIVLAQHDSTMPIARCAYIGVQGEQIQARIAFPPEGTSERSDEYRRLAKAGVISAVSVGFMPIKTEPLRFGVRYVEWEMLELSLVSVPALASALVTQRAHRSSATPRLDEARAYLAELRAHDLSTAEGVVAEAVRLAEIRRRMNS